MLKDFMFTSESVTEGHPDKIADGISDTILDALLAQDPKTRCSAETMITTGLVMLAGEISSRAEIDFQEIIRTKIKEIGYDNSSKGHDHKTCGILIALDKQSPDIAQGVNEGEGLFKDQGAGDQGFMFGYAVDETPSCMPLTIDLSHRLAKRLTDVRKKGILPDLCPDGKTQVTAEYKEGRLNRIESIVVSSQHLAKMSLKDVQEGIREEVIKDVVKDSLIDKNTKFFINPTGKFIIGGPMGDCGLTGRKIIVDTYGGHAAHGGGAFSGKDPSKVDRSAAYATRHIAKHIVAGKLADRVLIQVAYAIGVAKPISFFINTFGTERVELSKLHKVIDQLFDMRPKNIIDRLDLLKPLYSQTSAYGHFGRDIFSWEKLDQLEELKSLF